MKFDFDATEGTIKTNGLVFLTPMIVRVKPSFEMT